jgi:cyclase
MSKIATLGSVLGLLLLATGQAGAQTDYSKVEMKTTDLGHRTYMIEGMGGNITAAVGDDGVIMVDGQFAPLHDKIKAAVAAISKGPIRYLVNTHYHGDHTGGNEGFSRDGAVVTAHENVAKRLSAGTTNGLTGAKTPPAPQEAIPTRIYATEMTLRVGRREAALKHFANAHTDGDTYVYFADANVLATDVGSVANPE